MARRPSSRWFILAYGLLKPLSLLLGLAVATLAIMGLLHGLVPGVGMRAGLAGALVLGASGAVAWALPKHDAKAELATDVLAVGWLAGAVALTQAAPAATSPLLHGEAARIEAAGAPVVARAVTLLVGLPPDATDEAPGLAQAADPAPDPLQDPPAGPAPAESPLDPAELAPVAEPAPASPAPAARATVAYTPAEIFQRCADSVVSIEVEDKRGRKGGGTGFVVDAEGIVVTNHHVIDGAASVVVRLKDGTRLDKVSLLEADPGKDLAVLRVGSPAPLPPVALGTSADIAVGEQVVSIGNPLGLEHTLTDGVVSARRIWEGRKVIQMSVPVSPGNSGGPVFDRHGEVVGVTFAKLHPFRGENLNVAVPVDELKPMLKPSYDNAQPFGTSTW